MGVVLHSRPHLADPVLVASWPGIGSIGVIAVDALRNGLSAEEIGEIEPWEFFYPRKVVIRGGEIADLEFPSSRFFVARHERRDLLLFIGEGQPSESGSPYAEGEQAYRMANLVLDLAVDLGCRRVYTSGAAVAPIHHSARSRVWAVPSEKDLIDELRRLDNTVLMSDIEERGGQGSIMGLNGLLLGAARRRGMEAVCVMGEIPLYLQGLPIAYPKAAKSVLEVLCASLGVTVGMEGLAAMVRKSDGEIERLYELFPSEAKEQLEQLRKSAQAERGGPITEEDKRSILEDIDTLFGGESGEDER